MTDDGEIPGAAPDWHSLRQPLPPEVPAARTEPTAPAAEAADEAPATEWWRAAPPPPEAPPAAEPAPNGAQQPSFKPAPDWSKAPAPEPADGTGDDAQEPGSGYLGRVGEDWRETWSVHGSEALDAAHEVAVTMAEAVVNHLPNPEAAAQRHGLDIRWLRLKYNVPAVFFASLVTWGGSSLSDGVVHTLSHDGPFGLLGWVLMPLLLLGVLMVTPVGGPVGKLFFDILRRVLSGLGRLVARAWSVTLTGYLLRLVAATSVWAVVLGIARLIGRVAINWLTGA